MIVVFDADCLLCSRWVRFLLRHDRRQVFRFAAIQSAVGKQLLQDAGLQPEKFEQLETLLLVDGPNSYQHTTAILHVLHELGWPWRLAWAGWLIPKPLRDSAYRFIARHRYRLFGRRDTCFSPSAEQAQRFLQ